MRKLFLTLILILLCTTTLYAKTWGQHTAKTTYEYDVSPNSKLELRNINGDVDITSWGRDVIKITATKIIRNVNREQGRDIADDIKINIQKTKNVLKVETDLPEKEWWDFKGGSISMKVEFEITLPQKSDLFIKTVNGDIEISNVKGDLVFHTTNGDIEGNLLNGKLTAKTTSGDVELRNVTAKLDLKTVSGDIEGKNITGQMCFKTVSGEISLKNSRGKVDYSTVSGDINLLGHLEVSGSTVSGTLTLKTVATQFKKNTHLKSTSGNFNIYILNNAKLDIEFKTKSGKVRNQLENTTVAVNQIDEDNVAIKINNGGSKLVAKTLSGSMYLKNLSI